MLRIATASLLLVLEALAQDDNARESGGEWAFQSLRATPPPHIANAERLRQPLDAFVFAELQRRDLEPRTDADRRTLQRRLTYALTGLPPSPDEVAIFLADERPDAYERLVDRLLASPRHGVRWARAWFDVARFGESHGFEHDELRENAWPYRDWAVKAWNDDLPYDEFVRLQLAGDVLRPETWDVAATGFLVAGGYDRVGQEQQSAIGRAIARQDEFEEMIAATSQAFLGLTAHCARCHDHPHDPISQKEYYQLTAALAGVRRGDRDVPSPNAVHEEAERARLREELEHLEDELARLDEPARERFQQERARDPDLLPMENPRWSWEFASREPDACGPPLELVGNARFTPRGLVLEEGAHARSSVLDVDVSAKTLEVVLVLADLEQRGGAALSLQSLDGTRFDAIVFGERQPRRWIAGSEFFRRTRDFQAPAEEEAGKRPVHLAITWAEDGSIQLHRDGRPEGESYPATPNAFPRGTARLLFGLRHDPGAPGKFLRGTILRAALHERALGAEEIAARAEFARTLDSYVEREATLTEEEKQRRRTLLGEIHVRRATLELPRSVRAFAVTPGVLEETFLLRRGDPNARGEAVQPAGLRVLSSATAPFPIDDPDTEGQRRAALARWITAPTNPLYRRVIVNRMWAWIFGRGIVETPSDFGALGARPTHRELLDELALAFARDGDSLKGLERLLVTSSTFRQASTVDERALAVDHDARFLWRFPPRRLEAEMLWDTLLQASDTLDESMGGPGDCDFRWFQRSATHYYEPIDDLGIGSRRRALYRVWARGGRHPLLDAFDCPDPSTTAPRRRATTTPLQALALANHPQVLALTRRLAHAVERSHGDVEGRVNALFLRVYQRTAEEEERHRLVPFVREHGLEALARALIQTHEFLHVD